MDEEHYETPWEFKNRAIAAALSLSTNAGPAAALNKKNINDNKVINKFGVSICQTKVSTLSDENVLYKNYSSEYDKRRSSSNVSLKLNESSSGGTQKVPSPCIIQQKNIPSTTAAESGALVARITANNSNDNNIKSNSNVYADDPLLEKNLFFSAAIIEPNEDYLAKARCCETCEKVQQTQHLKQQQRQEQLQLARQNQSALRASRRFSTNLCSSNSNSQPADKKEINLNHHYPSVYPTSHQNEYNNEISKNSRNYMKQAKHRSNRLSFDDSTKFIPTRNDGINNNDKNNYNSNERGSHNGISVVCDGELHFHTPSTSSSSSSGFAFPPPCHHTSNILEYSPPSSAAKIKMSREQLKDIYPLVGFSGIECDSNANRQQQILSPNTQKKRLSSSRHNVAALQKVQSIAEQLVTASASSGNEKMQQKHCTCHNKLPNCCDAAENGYQNKLSSQRFTCASNLTNKSRPRLDEASIIHNGMERSDAERILKPMKVGDFLLRRRNESNLALSLRSTDGILHIKLEMRDGEWVLGEGPRFSTIASMLHAYRKIELPVRGVEHVRLRLPVMINQL